MPWRSRLRYGRFRSHPQCFLAIDPYALDSVSLPVSAMYAGLMHSQYLVWDRQSSTQSWLQRNGLLAGTGHQRIAWRFLEALRSDPVLMVLAGGMPPNARLFYAAREWAGALKDARKEDGSKYQIRYAHDGHSFCTPRAGDGCPLKMALLPQRPSRRCASA